MEQKELTTEQIARVFAMHIGCKVRHVKFPSTYYTLSGCYQQCVFIDNAAGQTLQPIAFERAKLLLKPLSSISDEDAIETVQVHLPSLIDISVKDYYRGGRSYGFATKYRYAPKRRFSNSDVMWSSLTPMQLQYLISKGYAVPLFFEPGHPLNGKTAIEIGLAIDSTQSAQS